MNIFEKIKVVCFDVDGTLTDGKYIISKNGDVSKSFYTRDFHGIEMLLRGGINVIVISQSDDKVIQRQFNRIMLCSPFWETAYVNMRLHLHMGCNNKRDLINKDLLTDELSWENVAYMGDAENDFECLKLASFSGCPVDAIEEVREMVQYPSDFKGGEGAVYDFCKYILKKRVS
jgi:3-deoxy-D-manno-octulosonate 8-phosphate phosphatase (KDO 8-P phosphatase)